jgi:uncharacterized linocin/CFP29 family protein
MVNEATVDKPIDAGKFLSLTYYLEHGSNGLARNTIATGDKAMPNGRNNFGWSDETRQRINTVIHDESARARIARRVLPLFGNATGFVDRVPGHQLRPPAAGQPLSLRGNQSLAPVEISVDFTLAPEEFGDEQAAMALATRAAYQLALAEDRIVLLGADAAPLLLAANVRERNLNEQKGLFRSAMETAAMRAQAPAPAAGAPPPQLPAGTTILDGILNAIAELRQRDHHGEYGAIVSPNLHREAFQTPARRREAFIYEIRSLLREGSFQYSSAATGRTGVIFSLGGHTVDMAVPVDASVELVNEERGALLRVVEQFRLRINDPTAVVALA